MKKWALFFALISPVMAKPNWKPLFDGKSIAGWHIAGDTKWNFNNADSGINYVQYNSSSQYTMFFTDKSDFDQFTIKYSYRLKAGCSGFFFRSRETTKDEKVVGIQVEAKNETILKEMGSLYCFQCWISETDKTGGKDGWVVQHTDQYSTSIAKPVDQYQDVILTVKNPFIYVNINGHQAVGGTAAGEAAPFRYNIIPVINAPGRIGLQVHGGQKNMDVSFKNIAILEGCGDSTSQNYDGKLVAGSTTQPAVYQNNNTCTGVKTLAEVKESLAKSISKVKTDAGALSVNVTYPQAHTFDILTLQGKVIFSGAAPGPHEYRLALAPKPGIYFARLTSSTHSANKRILVQ